ncbi:hypothetical protein HYALB_00008676 [Hymenoscyphus albidus]|uniref:DH domain-containing protein n=1 Tax=Hymenoscyphus albidus TaxID=595503 RepID=A0A9N9LD65_9HELO|nr:hypothetical protein HYALB_00008676 [Hymenoscyphus albidus]
MESGINADQNFNYRRPPHHDLADHDHDYEHDNPHQTQHIHPAHHPPFQPQHHHHRHHHQHLIEPHRQPTYEAPPLPDFESTSPQHPHQLPQLPPKLQLLTTANLQAITVDGFPGVLIEGGDPAEFYREYRGVQQSAHGYTDTTNGMAAAAASESRPAAAPSSPRSNGNGTIPRHPSVPVRNVKPSYRSASSPLDDRLGQSSAKSTAALKVLPKGQQPSVKDLLKRFDSNNEQLSASVRRSVGRVTTKEGAPGGRGYLREQPGFMARTANSLQYASSTRAGSSTRETPGGRRSPERSRTTQRTRFATEDQHSNNTLSSVARPHRPRHSVSAQPSKSMSNLSPTSPISNPSSQRPARRPLFGEVLVLDTGPQIATRRTSDSSLHHTFSGHHQRSRSQVDVSPSSPTAWYLGVTPQLDDVDPNKSRRRPSPGHNRNHSDFQDMKVNTMTGVNPSFQSPTSPSAQQTQNPYSRSTSRLPVSTKRLSYSSESSQQSRNNSPFTSKTIQNGKMRKPDSRPWSPAGRATTPTSRAMTPTQRTPRGVRGRKVEPMNGISLNAHIESPMPKASPPLRSSRPRQPVSTVTTTIPDSRSSSRRKNIDSPSSTTPQQFRTGMKLTRNGGFEDPKPRKIVDVGPVDFAARRAKIQRAYTKSIHESEQKEIRAANMRRLSERHARDVARANKEAEVMKTTPETPSFPAAEVKTEPESSPAPLHITTSFSNPNPFTTQTSTLVMEDSPTLGVPSGVDEEPQSAISCATGITEIDHEPQTEEAKLAQKPSHTRNTSNLSSKIIFTADELSPEQAMYGFNMDQQESIDIILAPPVDEPQAKLSPEPSEALKPTIFQHKRNSHRSSQHFLSSTVYTASPVEITPEGSIPQSFANHDEQDTSKGELSSFQSEPSSLNTYESTQDTSTQDTSINDHEYSVSPDTPDAPAPRLKLPNLRIALGSPSVAVSEPDNDCLVTPFTDMEDEGSVGNSISRRASPTYDPYNNTNYESQNLINRNSHQSSRWTDYSVDSTMDYNRGTFSKPASVVGTPDLEKRELSLSRRPSALQNPPVPPKPEGYSPMPSPRMGASFPRFPSPTPHIPPLSTGDGFAATFADQNRLSATSGPLWPDYSPPLPPIPTEASEPPLPPLPTEANELSPIAPTRTPPPPLSQSQRPPSSVYQSSHNEQGRNAESRRASDELYSPRASVSTPRSSTQISFEESAANSTLNSKPAEPETEEEKAAAKKLKDRLVRRHNIIKELVDTESVYLKDMNVVEEIYKGTAEACPKLDSGDVKTIFRNTDEIVAFTTTLLDEIKTGAAAIYSPRGQKKGKENKATTAASGSVQAVPLSGEDRFSMAATLNEELTDEQKDRRTFVGANFGKHMKKMQTVYTDYLKSSEAASARLAVLQTDASVQVWLGECNIVAKDLTAAWDLDALLVKPVQRITRYQLLFKEILECTDNDHPDYIALQAAHTEVIVMLKNIDELKKRIHMVGKIVNGRKRKDSDVRTGLAKAFGRSKEKAADKLPVTKTQDDDVYFKLHEKYCDDYLRLQVVLRDVEYYTRQAATYVHDFLRYLSAMELVMRLSSSPWPEIESKWARFNMSMRDMGTVALEEHVKSIRAKVIEPFEHVIEAYGAPGLAMKKRAKRRLDYDKLIASRASGAKLNEKDTAKVDQYEALNETLKIELPQLAALTEKLGNICLINFVMIQRQWYDIWQKKVRTVLEESQIPNEVADIVTMFNRDYKYVEVRAQELGIINGNFSGLEKVSSDGRASESESRRSRPSNLSTRSRALSINSDRAPPSLPTPEFAKRLSGQFVMSPTNPAPNVPQFAYASQPNTTTHSRANSGSPATLEAMTSARPSASLARPTTGRSFTSDSGMHRGNDYNASRRESGSTYNSTSYHHVDGPPASTRPFSGIFHSAMPLPDGPEDSQRSSRNSSRDRHVSGGYNVLYLAASLFEFNISATKSEAGYPYLTYQAGEIFDVIGEKGELWLAKNQDDPSDSVGWIWSKHFARLATD